MIYSGYDWNRPASLTLTSWTFIFLTKWICFCKTPFIIPYLIYAIFIDIADITVPIFPSMEYVFRSYMLGIEFYGIIVRMTMRAFFLSRSRDNHILRLNELDSFFERLILFFVTEECA